MFIMENGNNLEAWSEQPFDGCNREIDASFSKEYENDFKIEKGEVFYVRSEEEKAQDIRLKRNDLLKSSDINMLTDNFARLSDDEKEKWINYRSYLRDLPQQKDFPNVSVLSFEEWVISFN